MKNIILINFRIQITLYALCAILLAKLVKVKVLMLVLVAKYYYLEFLKQISVLVWKIILMNFILLRIKSAKNVITVVIIAHIPLNFPARIVETIQFIIEHRSRQTANAFAIWVFLILFK